MLCSFLVNNLFDASAGMKNNIRTFTKTKTQVKELGRLLFRTDKNNSGKYWK